MQRQARRLLPICDFPLWAPFSYPIIISQPEETFNIRGRCHITSDDIHRQELSFVATKDAVKYCV